MKFDMKTFLLFLLLGPLAIFFIKPKHEIPPKEEADLPVTEPGTDIEVLFGERLQDRPLLYWYGDLKTVPFYSTAKKK